MQFQYTYIVQIEHALSNLEPIYTKISDRGKIPITTHYTHLNLWNYEDFITLHEEGFPTPKNEILDRIIGNSPELNYNPKLCGLLLHENQAIACSIVAPCVAYLSCYIYGIYIREQYRKRWAVVMLKTYLFRQLRARGYEYALFQALHGTNRDTIRHAQKLQARVIR